MNKIKLLLMMIVLLGFTQQSNAQLKKKSRILFILDGSGSMGANLGATTRIASAKRILSHLIDSLSVYENLEMALRVYGHTQSIREKDCKDTKLEVPFSPNNHNRLKAKLKSIIPKGYTLIAESLLQSAKDFPEEKGVRNIIILITDGLEECSGDPCAISKALQAKGVVLRPFIIGVGVDGEKFKAAYQCVGKYYDANNDKRFEEIMNVVINQALNTTTAQINLLDITGKPLETNVPISIHDATTGELLKNYLHTMNGYGNPDTLYLDPMRKFNVIAHTLPPREVKSAELVPGRHNTIAIQTPQGDLQLTMKGITTYDRLQAIIKEDGKTTTVNAQEFNTKTKYIVGKYDLEILSYPRIYLNDVKISQNKTTTIEIPQPGVLNFMAKPGYKLSIFQRINDKMKWVMDVKDIREIQQLLIQPGTYSLMGRKYSETRIVYSFEREIIIKSGLTTNFNL